MSLCGLQEKGDPSDEEFERHAIKYKDVSIIAFVCLFKSHFILFAINLLMACYII